MNQIPNTGHCERSAAISSRVKRAILFLSDCFILTSFVFAMTGIEDTEIFKFDAQNTHTKGAKDPSISVKLCRKCLSGKGLVLQIVDGTRIKRKWYSLAFRFDCVACLRQVKYSIKATASRRISENSTRGYNWPFVSTACLPSASHNERLETSAREILSAKFHGSLTIWELGPAGMRN